MYSTAVLRVGVRPTGRHPEPAPMCLDELPLCRRDGQGTSMSPRSKPHGLTKASSSSCQPQIPFRTDSRKTSANQAAASLLPLRKTDGRGEPPPEQCQRPGEVRMAGRPQARASPTDWFLCCNVSATSKKTTISRRTGTTSARRTRWEWITGTMTLDELVIGSSKRTPADTLTSAQ